MSNTGGAEQGYGRRRLGIVFNVFLLLLNLFGGQRNQ